jgi:hypothetical protein
MYGNTRYKNIELSTKMQATSALQFMVTIEWQNCEFFTIYGSYMK